MRSRLPENVQGRHSLLSRAAGFSDVVLDEGIVGVYALGAAVLGISEIIDDETVTVGSVGRIAVVPMDVPADEFTFEWPRASSPKPLDPHPEHITTVQRTIRLTTGESP